MKKCTLLITALLCGLSWLSAAGISVSGVVIIGQEELPAPDYPVEILLESQPGVAVSAFTDAQGRFSAMLEHDFSQLPEVNLMVQAFDFCTGETLTESFELANGNNSVDNLIFKVCAGINPPPPPEGCQAFFFYEQTSADPYLVQFFDLSANSDETDSWAWDFGDGQSSTAPEPVHEYAEAGLYEVTLTTTSDTCSSTFALTVEVGDNLPCVCTQEYAPVCVAVPSGETVVFPNACYAFCEGFGPEDFVNCSDNGYDFCQANFLYAPASDSLSLTFSDASTAFGDSITTYLWKLDGQEFNGPSFTYTFPESGVFSVTLSITTEGGCTSTFTSEVRVGNTGSDCICPEVFDPVCVATSAGGFITLPNACIALCLGYDESMFTNCGNGPCICPDYFNPVCVVENGDTLAFDNPCFAECEGYGPEDYFSCDDPDECICPEYVDPVCVVENGDTISFVNPCYAECEGYTTEDYFDCGQLPDPCNCYQIYDPVCVLSPDGELITFSNNCYAECAGYGPQEYFPCNGGGNGFCQAEFEAVPEAPEDGIVRFLDHSFSDDGEIIAWKWDFGDGSSSQAQNPVHDYNASGMVQVTLTIETSEGCTSTVSRSVLIGEDDVSDGPDCQAMFRFEQSPDEPLSFEFSNLSLGNPEEYFWSFGDGNSSTAANPQHSYAQPGLYLVSLTISEDDCSSTIIMLLFTNQDVIYEDECQALFVPVRQDSLTYTFLNFSYDPSGEFLWEFGDGSSSNKLLPTHTYATGGAYEVRLTATSSDGCTSTFEAVVNVSANNFTGQPNYTIINSTDEANEEGAVPIKAFPNPTEDELQIQFNLQTGGRYELRLLQASGQLVRQQMMQLPAGKQQEQIQLSQLPSGVYYLQLRGGERIQTVKVVKQ